MAKNMDKNNSSNKRRNLFNKRNNYNRYNKKNVNYDEHNYNRDNVNSYNQNNMNNYTQNDYNRNMYNNTYDYNHSYYNPYYMYNYNRINDDLYFKNNRLNNEIKSLKRRVHQLENRINKKDDVIYIDIDTQTENTKSKDNKELPPLFNILNTLFPQKKKKTEQNINQEEFKLDPSIEYLKLDNKIKTLDDLIKLGEQYDSNLEQHYTFDIKMLNNMIKPLKELNQMIGLKEIKRSIIDFVMYHCQRLEKQNQDMFHTIIQGPPGVGKTEIGKILAKIYKSIGIISNDTLKIYKRSDLIGQYLGHTAAKTQEAIDECENGVLFIDEAYSLGNAEGKDSYSKECLDTLNANLTENKKNFICIIAGYEKSLDKCFFSYNEGLRRRFSFKYTINGYSPNELSNIFVKKLNDIKFDIDKINTKEINTFFEKNKDNFPHYAGDMETLVLNCKIAHSIRIFGQNDINLIKKISYDDIKDGLERFLLHRKNKENILYGLYI
jgi:SpoVK/Ycf46/Vps4 family AAA+-type ATPase